MRFEDDFAQALFERSFPSTEPLDVKVELYLNEKSDYVQRIRDWRRSQTQKQNWRKHRFKYVFGQKRFQRRVSGSVSNSLLSLLKKRAGVKEDLLVMEFPEYELFEWLKALSEIQTAVLEQATFYDLEENYVDISIWVEDVVTDLSVIQGCSLERQPLTEDQWDLLFLLLNREDLQKFHESLLESKGQEDLLLHLSAKKESLGV